MAFQPPIDLVPVDGLPAAGERPHAFKHAVETDGQKDGESRMPSESANGLSA